MPIRAENHPIGTVKTSLALSGLDEPLKRLDITAEGKSTDPMNSRKPESMTLTDWNGEDFFNTFWP